MRVVKIMRRRRKGVVKKIEDNNVRRSGRHSAEHLLKSHPPSSNSTEKLENAMRRRCLNH